MTKGPDQTREEVLKAVAGAGFEITGDQLARWHREGLLPKPARRSLGRGHGTMTLYPAGTAKQAVALCEIRTRNRSLARAAFRLWWDGFDICPEQVRASLLKAAGKVDEDLPRIGTSGPNSKSPFDNLIGRRLGRERRARLEAAVSAAAIRPSGTPVSLAELALPAMPPSIEDVLGLALPIMMSSLSNISVVSIAKEAAFEELCAARDEMKTLFEAMRRWSEPMAWLYGRRGAVFQMLADLPKFVTPKDLPDMLCAALVLRRVLPEQLRSLLLSPPPPLLQEVAVFKAVHDGIAGANTVITPMAVRALIRDKEASQRYRPKIEAFIEQHQEEVRRLVSPEDDVAVDGHGLD